MSEETVKYETPADALNKLTDPVIRYLFIELLTRTEETRSIVRATIKRVGRLEDRATEDTDVTAITMGMLDAMSRTYRDQAAHLIEIATRLEKIEAGRNDDGSV